MDLITKEVDFNGIGMLALKNEEGIFVSVKSICESIGLDYSAQLKRIKNDEVVSEGLVKIAMPTKGGNQEISMLDIGYLPLWVTGISSNAVREEIKPYIKSFKLRAKDILAEAFIENKSQFMIPKTFGEALKLAYEQQLQIEQQLLELKEQAKEIDYQSDVIIGFVKDLDYEQKRQTLNTIMRKKGSNYQERWHLLYSHFEKKFHMDLRKRMERYNLENKPKATNKLDYIEKIGLFNELYEIATKLFHEDIENIINHYREVK